MSLGVNKLLIEWYAWTGEGCEAQLLAEIKDPPAVQSGAFQTGTFCDGTGIQLKAGRSYRITLDDPVGRLFDRTAHADLGGFSGTDPVHRIAKPLRRWWTENWFVPIARIGAKGGEEYVLRPLASYHPRNTAPKLDAISKEDECWKEEKPGCGRFDLPRDGDIDRWSTINPTPKERLTLVMELTPKRKGELFMYVNDASMSLYPGGHRLYYKNNYGVVQVKVEELGL